MARRLYVPPPGVQLPVALQALRQVSEHLLHPLAAQALGHVLIRPAAEAALRSQALTLREAAACLAEAMPDWARGASVARPWQDGRQARMQPSFAVQISSSQVTDAPLDHLLSSRRSG